MVNDYITVIQPVSNMKNLAFLTALTVPYLVIGQTLTEAEFILPMYQLPVHMSAYQPSSEGAGMTWDYSNLVVDSSFVMEFALPIATTQGVNFPLTNAVEVRYGNFPGNQYAYYELNANGWYEHGYATDAYSYVYYNIDSVQDPLTVLEFPCVYNDIWSDQAGDFIEGITTSTTVDGFGTLEMPYGTVANVLRVNTYKGYYSWWADNPYTRTISFYRPGIGTPLLETTEIGHTSPGSGQIHQLKWIDANVVTGVEESGLQGIGIDLYPNPSSSNTQVVFGAHGSVSIELIDSAGRVLWIEDLGTLPPGIHGHTLDLSGLAVGMYTVLIRNDNNEQGVERLVVE